MTTAPTFLLVRRWAIAAVAAVAVTFALAAQGSDEPAPALTASTLLPAGVVKGAHHRVAEVVRTDTYFHEFALESGFGPFEATGRTQLAVRIQEIEALAALRDVSKTEVFLAAAGQSVVNVGKGAASAVTDPAGTVKGIGAGVKRFGVNLGRRTQRAAEGTDDKGGQPAEGDGARDSAAASASKSVLGVTSATRRWAQKVNVDPYTTNPVLKQALEDIAKVDVAGSIATKVVVPVPAPVGLTASVGDLVWGRDPEEVRKVNEARMKELGVADEAAKAFLSNAWLTLTYQTRLVAALHAVRAGGCADYVKTAAEARSEREALFFVESAEMLQARHARVPVTRLLPDSRAAVAASAGGLVTVLLPLDWVRSTAATTAALRDIEARARAELGATRVEVSLTGRASDRVMAEFRGLT
jgi:hypothetical protein